MKHNEIEHLKTHLHEQERILVKSEKYILEDIALFDQFLDAWNRNVSDATLRYTFDYFNHRYSSIFRADEESRKNEELSNEIKRLQKILITHHNDQNHLIDTLKQSRRYQQFLFKFAPEVRYPIKSFCSKYFLHVHRNGVMMFSSIRTLLNRSMKYNFHRSLLN